MAKCKTPGRKRQKRPPADRKQRLDDDLLELAEVIAEFQLDNNASGWFLPPWRVGWYATELAFEVWNLVYASKATEIERGIGRYFRLLLNRRITDTQAYLQITDDLTAVGLHGETEGRKLLMAALRCYQLTVSNSSGGGEVFNDALKRGFEGLSVGELLADEVAAIVLTWRCLDAIGTVPTLRQDANDRLRRAFVTAWRRGLYLAAYSLPPSVDYTVKPTVVKA